MVNSLEKLKALSSKFKPRKVEIDCEVFFVCVMSAYDKDCFDVQWGNYRKDKGGIGLRAFLVAFCLCDEKGNRTFNSGDDKEVTAEFANAVSEISKLPIDIVELIFKEALNSNGIGDDDQKN